MKRVTLNHLLAYILVYTDSDHVMYDGIKDIIDTFLSRTLGVSASITEKDVCGFAWDRPFLLLIRKINVPIVKEMRKGIPVVGSNIELCLEINRERVKKETLVYLKSQIMLDPAPEHNTFRDVIIEVLGSTNKDFEW